MAESEINIINHLIEVEQQAESLVKEAQLSADKKISLARAKADAEYAQKFEAIVKKYDGVRAARKTQIETDYKKRFDEYVAAVKNAGMDADAFNARLKEALSSN
ncbi:MAG: hypothetical protein ACTTKL_08735 [Treponema sp.]